jgi:multiple sugar transport system permease protein
VSAAPQTRQRTGSPAEASPLRASLPLVPSVLLFLVFLLGPILYALWGSLTDAELTGSKSVDPEFIGLANYTDVLTDPLTWEAVGLTLIFLLGSAIIGQNVVGILVALLLEEASSWVQSIVKTMIVAAWVLPEIVAAFVMYAFFADGGTLNTLGGLVGLPEFSWLFAYPMLSVIIANIWRGTAFSMLIYSAALSNVDPALKEAAEIDGASWRQRTFRVTLPIIGQTIMTNLMLVTLQTLSAFTLIWVMTAGGPGTATTTLPVLAYQEAFKFGEIGKGTALSVLLLAIGAVSSLVYIRMLTPRSRRAARTEATS